ncbi:IclR family transcriptional regulator [Allopusillimonas ginsengisoli]|uniref:IclR family transcriptional regulator n=1 Tax=Allopusillimonas ginsengisoli TaxID=453575 RepID=UPI001ADAE9D7|nr:IclR family transcriptional regulator [Allopusillimonas ginsengisoli]
MLEIIDLISGASHAISAVTIAETLNIPRPTVHRLLQQLADEKFLTPNMRGQWEPAQRLRTMALGIIQAPRFRALHHAVLERLAGETGETCGISIPAPSGTHMIYFDRAQSNWPLQINLSIGSQVPASCTASGKLYLASLPKSQRDTLLRYLPLTRMARNTITSQAALSVALDKIEAEQIGHDNEEFIDGMVAVAVPIRDEQGNLAGCLFVHAPTIRVSLSNLLLYVPLLKSAAHDLRVSVGPDQNL